MIVLDVMSSGGQCANSIGINEWLVCLVQSMYKDVRNRVRVDDGYSEEFGVVVGAHQCSVLCP